MSQETQSSPINKWALVGLGVVLVVVGGYLAANPTNSITEQVHGFSEALEKQGIPLDPLKTISTIGMFLVLFPVIDSFFITPLRAAINDRTSELERTFAEAEGLRTEMTDMRSSYEKRLAETEANAREQIQAQVREAQAVGTQLRAQAAAERDDMVKKAQAEIQAEKNQVLTELRTHVVSLTLGAAEKVLGESVDSDKNRRLINEFVDKIEVPG